jgi:hypothetical protein
MGGGSGAGGKPGTGAAAKLMPTRLMPKMLILATRRLDNNPVIEISGRVKFTSCHCS